MISGKAFMLLTKQELEVTPFKFPVPALPNVFSYIMIFFMNRYQRWEYRNFYGKNEYN